MSSTIHRLAGRDGFSLEVPGAFLEATALERGSVCLAAHAEPWPWPQAFRPNLTAEVTALAPDRATIPQLSALTIAAQIALGAHVAACDIWPGPTDEDGRRIISLYPAMDTTVVQLQYVTIRGGRAITVSVQHGAEHHAQGVDVFTHAVNTISCDFSDPAPRPDPATMPRLDAFARERGMEVESLSGVRAAQPFKSTGPPLDDARLEALRRGKPRRGATDVVAALQAADFVTERGRLAELGEAAHRALSSPQREVTIEIVADGDPRVAVLAAYQRNDSTAVVASAPAGVPGAGTTLDVIPSQTTPVALARWIGLAPAWTFGIATDAGATLQLEAALLDARLVTPGTPQPPDGSTTLARMWAQTWQVANLRADAADSGLRVIITPEAGVFRLDRVRASGEASLTPLPSAQFLLELLRLGGFA